MREPSRETANGLRPTTEFSNRIWKSETGGPCKRGTRSPCHPCAMSDKPRRSRLACAIQGLERVGQKSRVARHPPIERKPRVQNPLAGLNHRDRSGPWCVQSNREHRAVTGFVGAVERYLAIGRNVFQEVKIRGLS